MTMNSISRYIEDLLASRRPRAFRSGPDEAAMVRTAVILRAARPGSGAPTEEFVTGLRKRLAAELGGGTHQEPAAKGRPRRSFMATAAAAAAGAAAACVGGDQLLTRPDAPAAGGEIVPDRGTWQAVLASADLPEGAVRPFTLSTLVGFVQRTGGRPRAVSGVCTHQGCRLVLDKAATELDCPCHGAVFALDGTVLRQRLSVPINPLPGIAAREHGGIVEIYAPKSAG